MRGDERGKRLIVELADRGRTQFLVVMTFLFFWGGVGGSHVFFFFLWGRRV